MELNWTTFILEIINFLVLVWILKHFFYQPILDVIARRQAGIEKRLADAKALHDDAESLQAHYQERLTIWEQEKQLARQRLRQEIEEERSKSLAALQSELLEESEKARVAETKRQAYSQQKTEETALILASRFASRLLGQAASPELEAKLLDMVTNELPRLTSEQIDTLRNNWGQKPETVLVTSAYPLGAEQRAKLQQVIDQVIGTNLPLQFEQDHHLIAGIRITIGAWLLGANLQDELKAFSDFAHATSRA